MTLNKVDKKLKKNFHIKQLSVIILNPRSINHHLMEKENKFLTFQDLQNSFFTYFIIHIYNDMGDFLYLITLLFIKILMSLRNVSKIGYRPPRTKFLFKARNGHQKVQLIN